MLYLLHETAFKDFLKYSRSVNDSLMLDPPIKSDKEKLNQIRERIRVLLKGEVEDWPSVAVFQLLKTVEMAVHLHKATQKDWILINEIRESVGALDYIKPFSNTDAWKEAVECAVQSINSNSYRHAFGTDSRINLVAKAFTYLEKNGFPYKLGTGGFYLPDKSLNHLTKLIEKKIIRVGGYESVNRLLNTMQQSNRIYDGSLLHARDTKQWQGKQDVGTPWHYIYNLCVKHLGAVPKSKNIQRDLSKMEVLAKALAATLDVETHSSYEHLTIPVHSVLFVLQETVVYDEVFSIPQWQPRSAQFLIPKWLDILDDKGCELPVVSLEQWKRIALKILDMSLPDRLQAIHPWQLVEAGVSVSQAEEIIDRLSQSERQVNSNYLQPMETQNRTSVYYPILGSSKASYYIQPKAIAARALMERFLNLGLRDEIQRSFPKNTGEPLELLTSATLKNFGANVSIFNGKYYLSKKDVREIDLVVETPERVFIFECKNKALKNISRGGDDVSELEDLNKSFLKMIDQLAGHEATLKRNGEILFTDGSKLTLGNRKIEKIAVSLFDHGSIKDRTFHRALLDSVLHSSFKAVRSKDEKTVNEVNGRIASLNENIVNILKLSGEEDHTWGFHEFTMSTWWLSIDQLYYICLQHDDLWEGLKQIRHLTFKSGDLMYEISRSKKLNENGKKISMWSEKNGTLSMM